MINCHSAAWQAGKPLRKEVVGAGALWKALMLAEMEVGVDE